MYLFFDTETTGIPRNYKAPVSDLANWPRVIQLAFLLTDAAGTPLAGKEYLIQPAGFTIPADATRVHGITTQQALAQGIPLAAALAEFLTCLPSAKTLVAHNMAYDENVLGAEFLRAKLANPLPQAKRFCTMQAGTNYCRIPGKYGNFKWPTLSELHIKLFGKDFRGAHGAQADIQACAACFFAMKGKGIIAA
jgi:DNA polymerase III epsilon subunit-like protein